MNKNNKKHCSTFHALILTMQSVFIEVISRPLVTKSGYIYSKSQYFNISTDVFKFKLI